ncbi:bifunctional [glutamine synthetase] adenylyltransferase/[glutamine synthetase]-adenylyl-L-tyrosine phosphorylase [Stappia sp. F7233]|uniref:Bifunctional glutamine synthetase adenylyltransferase/adenylyl-removing enzyme n=1 Tax=Stappia albiluteola TaxID=2758565 RepID=A0A839ABW9_9HYPH|nr:bifunctional [glutamine synthetase] adenylyltransferase/[glutamine synthetase]-adenylyl-L-tyrosine phosphorylase [Stappia albiluteola]MBA5776387.1 bifunctional [glutamine synthetase] adenylyltransferase/[glutamine synthetase]-adenylyl-L-tyrosine phosphorylase [Stappia albiluteola]
MAGEVPQGEGQGLAALASVYPKPVDEAAAASVLEDLEGAPFEDEAVRRLLSGIFANAPYLRDLGLIDKDRLAEILRGDPRRRVAGLIEAARDLAPADEASLMTGLRNLKKDLALTLGLADIGGVLDLDEITGALSRFADAALTAAIRFCLRDLAARGRFVPVKEDEPEFGSGFIVLAMGKYGALELNYSSDIDLIALYDPHKAPLAGAAEAPVEFVRLTKRVVKILSDRTADGYVFRTDLRLRPDPGATPLAMSVPAAFVYYESLGQNWERAALIKARACAGDIVAGESFLKEIAPFIWRKYLDYAAIADVHSIKRQIHAHKGHGRVAVAGHNVKLGRGGIREVEFFAQTQQLIAGGRIPELRGRRTLDTLATLTRLGWIEEDARAELTDAYRFLRAVEHRIQMVNDEQTHSLPEDEAGLARIAYLMGYRERAAFEKDMRRQLTTVQRHYAALFEDEPELASELGNLVFTGDDDDPDTLETLGRLGFKRPVDACRIIKAWHFGRYPAVRSTKARERLTELHPLLIDALARTDNADQALIAFDGFLSKLPAGVQLFSLLKSNPQLLQLMATVMGAAPRMAEVVSRRVHVLDAVLDPAFFDAMPRAADFEAGLDRTLSLARFYEEALDRARIFAQEQKFLIGLRLISDTLNAHQMGHALARLAEVIVQRLSVHVVEHVAESHGRLAGGDFAILAMGKLGGREMTSASDLDLILLYDFDEETPKTDGARPLEASQYYIRLTQRLVTALSAPTAEGQLYEVDFRLRPSGNAGPLATRLSSFEDYQKSRAWTWEHMALTRARVIAATSDDFRKRIETSIEKTLCAAREEKTIGREVASMRARIEAEKGTSDIWDLKQVAGGMVDIEFVAQYLQLVHSASHPDILNQNTETALGKAAEAGVLSAADAEVLIPAIRLYHALTQVLRLAWEGGFKAETAPRGVIDLLLRASSEPDFSRLEALLRETQGRVRATFERLAGEVKPDSQ